MRRTLTVLVLIFLVIAAGGQSRPVRAAQNGAIRMTVEAGFQGRFREGQWLPLLINVANDGPDVSGELRIASGSALNLSTSGYATSVELPTQSNKQLFLYVTLEAYTQQVQVELAATNGAILQTVSIPVTRTDSGDRLYAVVTESPTGSVDLTSARGGGDAYQIDWRLDNIPPLAQAMQGLDALLLTDVDTGKLSTEQRRAIQEWVLSGGHLIVSGGPNWQKTRAGVDTLLPMSATSTTTLSTLNGLLNFAGTSNDKLSEGSVIAVQGQATADTRVLAQQDTTPLIVRGALGQGIVDYLTVDPGLEPFRSWSNRGQLWIHLLTTMQRPGWSNGIVDTSEAAHAADFIKGLRLPDIFQLAGFLAVYIILIGPLNYLILRRLRRLEWAWFTIPLIILLTSITAYVTGFSLRGAQATVNRMSLVQVWPGTERARVDGVVGVLSPRRAIYNIAAEGGLTLRILNSDPYGNLNDTLSGIRIEEGTRYMANRVPVDAGLSATFVTSGYIAAPAFDGTAVLRLDKNGRASLSGQVTNTSDLTLTDAQILVMGTTYPVGNLAPGESHSFTFDVNALDDALPALGSPVYNQGRSAYNGYSQRTMLLREMLAPRTSTSAPASEQQDAKRRQIFLNSMTDETDTGAGRGVSVYLAAWSASSPVGVAVDTPFTTEDNTLYFFKLASRIQTPDNQVKLGSGYMIWSPMEKIGSRDHAPYSLYLTAGEQAGFRFSPLPALHLNEISQITLSLRKNGAVPTNTALWDWQTGQWVALSPPRGSNEIYTITDPADLTRFIGPQNAIQVLIQPSNSSVGVDRIDVTYNGTLEN